MASVVVVLTCVCVFSVVLCRYVFESPLPAARLARQLADKAQIGTQRSWKRPYGVGLLLASYDSSGPGIRYVCPSGNSYDYLAFAMGARSQASRTYLERVFEQFSDASRDALIDHALRALAASLQDGELSAANATVAVVGKDVPFTILEGTDLEPFLDALREEGAADGPDGPEGAAPEVVAAGETREEAELEAAAEDTAPMED